MNEMDENTAIASPSSDALIEMRWNAHSFGIKSKLRRLQVVIELLLLFQDTGLIEAVFNYKLGGCNK